MPAYVFHFFLLQVVTVQELHTRETKNQELRLQSSQKKKEKKKKAENNLNNS
jgi:hypothetical protein